ncbi:flagellar basal-body rod protein FlgF [Buchnera aphidicola]|uniref:flagellar basal-body rod protein FlgF n=1 Tax=Buchnera aphidicola TaxID=9 RepID=UPI003BEEE000
MENAIYDSMVSANQLLNKQNSIANNLANMSTTGFKENFIYIIKQYSQNKNNVNHNSNLQEKEYYNTSTGLLDYTNRNLDIFIKDNGWLTVKDKYGKEAYTKNGHIIVNPQGQLTVQNHKIVGYDNNYIKIPKQSDITILSNGEIVNKKNKKNTIVQYNIGRLKLVQLPMSALVKKGNGLYYLNKKIYNENTHHNNRIQIKSGVLENSNVNPTKNMIDMISNARQFDMQMKMISMYDQNTEYANQILNINS